VVGRRKLEGRKKKKNWKWRTLSHNGVNFAPPYIPHGVKMKYDGEEVELNPEQEEIATFFAKYIENDTHMKKPQFSKNFFKEFKAVLGKRHKIKKYELCDFTPITEYCKAQGEVKKQLSTEEKKSAKKRERDYCRKIWICYDRWSQSKINWLEY